MPYYVEHDEVDFSTDFVLWWVYDRETGRAVGAWCRAKD